LPGPGKHPEKKEIQLHHPCIKALISMKPLEIGLFVVAGGFCGALVMNWQVRHYPTTAGTVRMAAEMKSPVLPPVPSLEFDDPPAPEPELTPARQPIRVQQNIKQPLVRAVYNRTPAPEPAQHWNSAFVVPVPNSGCALMQAAESETIQAIVQLELSFAEVVETLRHWTRVTPPARGGRPSPPVASTGTAVWRRGPRDAFGRLQSY
jgi:hypothetical protein